LGGGRLGAASGWLGTLGTMSATPAMATITQARKKLGTPQTTHRHAAFRDATFCGAAFAAARNLRISGLI
jgi:hypothetical protein